MGWMLPKPWENGYISVTEQVKGTVGPGQNRRIRRWVEAQMQFTASFIGPNKTPVASLPGWTKQGGTASAVLNGTGGVDFIGGTDAVYMCPDITTPKHFAQTIVRIPSSTPSFRLCGRVKDVNNFIGLRRNNLVWELYSVVNGVYGLIRTSNVVATDGDVLRIEFLADTVTVYRNGAVLMAAEPIPAALSGNTRAGFVVRNVSLASVMSAFSCGTY